MSNPRMLGRRKSVVYTWARRTLGSHNPRDRTYDRRMTARRTLDLRMFEHPTLALYTHRHTSYRRCGILRKLGRRKCDPCRLG